MTRGPHISGTRLARALKRAGFRVVHRKGSHAFFAHADDASRVAVVPLHKGRNLPPGTLRAILRGARITLDELQRLL